MTDNNSKKWLKKITWPKVGTALFGVVLVGVVFVALLLPDAEISSSERRKLTQFPTFSFEAFWDGSFTEELEGYLKDQFPGRDFFRTVKAEADLALFGKQDSGGYYKEGDAIYQIKPPLQEKNVRWAGTHFAEILEQYFPEADVYYGVIPDKEEFLAASPDRQEADGGAELLAESSQAEHWLGECLPEAVCISIGEQLSLEDYYRTDIHWRQECLSDVADLLIGEMQSEQWTAEASDGTGSETAGTAKGTGSETAGTAKGTGDETAGTADGDFAEEVSVVTEDFLGGNACASAFWVAPETMFCVTSPVIENAIVYDFEKETQVSIYSPEKLAEGTDPYDYYLWGARALLTIENPAAPEGAGNLLVFRDSFGSSLAPLLVKGYARITLVDLRYVTMDYAAQLLGEMDYEDVLILYSRTMLNNSGTLKF